MRTSASVNPAMLMEAGLIAVFYFALRLSDKRKKRLSGAVFCSAWEMVKGFDAVWADFCPAKPCLPSSIYGILNRKNRETARMGRLSVF